MPLLGIALGAPLGHVLGGAAEYIAIGVLLAFGLYTLTAKDNEEHRLDQLAEMHGLGLVLLGVSISLGELAIGFTFGLLQLPTGLVIAVIALQAFIVGRIEATSASGSAKTPSASLAPH
jgi:putative Mn2+ efflux pump MntP